MKPRCSSLRVPRRAIASVTSRMSFRTSGPQHRVGTAAEADRAILRSRIWRAVSTFPGCRRGAMAIERSSPSAASLTPHQSANEGTTRCASRSQIETWSSRFREERACFGEGTVVIPHAAAPPGRAARLFDRQRRAMGQLSGGLDVALCHSNAPRRASLRSRPGSRPAPPALDHHVGGIVAEPAEACAGDPRSGRRARRSWSVMRAR